MRRGWRLTAGDRAGRRQPHRAPLRYAVYLLYCCFSGTKVHMLEIELVDGNLTGAPFRLAVYLLYWYTSACKSSNADAAVDSNLTALLSGTQFTCCTGTQVGTKVQYWRCSYQSHSTHALCQRGGLLRTSFTCFTGTKTQILTLLYMLVSVSPMHSANDTAGGSFAGAKLAVVAPSSSTSRALEM
jgi:hypothetical protein